MTDTKPGKKFRVTFFSRRKFQVDIEASHYEEAVKLWGRAQYPDFGYEEEVPGSSTDDDQFICAVEVHGG